jgi:hypothetical protein
LHDPIATLRIPRAGMAWVNANTSHTHWSEKAKRVKAWREMTLLQAHRQQFPKGLPYCEIQPTFVFSSKRHRDPGNFVLTTKAIVDALCTGPKPPHGWGAWVDDDPRYLRELMPILLVVPDSPSDGVIIRCYPKDTP